MLSLADLAGRFEAVRCALPFDAYNLRRFLRYVQPRGECWIWTGTPGTDAHPYGEFSVTSAAGERKHFKAHRYAYEALIGPISGDLFMDHFRCENKRCANPAHVRPVSKRENALRQDGPTSRNLAKACCLRGHPLEGANLRPDKRGWRSCRTCWRPRDRDRKRILRAARKAVEKC